MTGHADYLEGLRSEHADAVRKEHLIANAIHRQQMSNMDDYPEFHYG